MNNKRKNEIRAFWWGRHYPRDYIDIAQKRKWNDDDYKAMEWLKDFLTNAWKDGIDLGWGYQFTSTEFVNNSI